MRAFAIILSFGILVTTAVPTWAQSMAQGHDLPTGMSAQTDDHTASGHQETPPGGVPGNAPFNNQIRKHTAPLQANGR